MSAHTNIVRRHLELLRANLPDDVVTPLWWARERASFYPRSIAGAVSIAQSRADDLYVAVAFTTGAQAKKIGPRGRVRARTAAGLAALTVDLDVIGTPDGRGGVKQVGAATIEHALAAARLVAEPTLTIRSGGGVQSWHLFDPPLLFSTAEERDQVTRVAAQWQEAHRQAAGFAIDSTHDLARLMRLAGTLNMKAGGDGTPVTIDDDAGPRHDFAALAELVAGISVDDREPGRAEFNGRPSDEQVRALIAHLCVDLTFRELWERTPERFGGDDSRYDIAIVGRCVRRGLSDDEARAVAAASRLKRRPGDPKVERDDYWRMTIAKARQESPRSYNVEVDVKGNLKMPPEPPVDAPREQAQYLTAAFGLDPRKPITSVRIEGVRGPDGHARLERADAEAIYFEPVRLINTPMRLKEALNWQTGPTDSTPLPYKAAHCAQIARVIVMLADTSARISEAEQTEAIIAAYTQRADPIEGITTYADAQQRYAAANALRSGPRYLIDDDSGELVIAMADLAETARRHMGTTLARGWLDGRMASIGWKRLTLDGREQAGRAGRHSRHVRVFAYRGKL